MSILDEIQKPIVLAPLAGGPSTPELAAAVSEAGGFGFLAAGYLGPDELAERIGATRKLTDRPLGVNVFAPVPGPASPEAYSAYVRRLTEWAAGRGYEVGEPRYGDDAYTEKIELLVADPVSVVSFTFACPERDTIKSLKQAGSEVWITVTSPTEADEAVAAG